VLGIVGSEIGTFLGRLVGWYGSDQSAVGREGDLARGEAVALVVTASALVGLILRFVQCTRHQ
jgi:hypothetical protein